MALAITYSEHDGKREESFSKAIMAIALVVRSESWRFIAVSTMSTASASVTCKVILILIQQFHKRNYTI